MKRLSVFFFLCCLPCIAGPVSEWGEFEIGVRDQTIAKGDAKKKFCALYDSLYAAARGDAFIHLQKWTFPVAGRSKKDAGHGGFRPDIRYGTSPVKGYDFYDGNLHGGHPAYDIFIRDANRDCRDDRSGKSVSVVAPVDLLVLSTNTGWQAGSPVRGGNYIWALFPPDNLLLYFAHLDSIKTVTGSVCRTGDTIGTVGRTGTNAASSRSPTHLHFMVLKVMGDSLAPFDYWKKLPLK